MKRNVAATAVVVLAVIAFLRSQSRLDPQDLPNVLPVDAKVEQLALATDMQRTYYTTPSGDVWLYDHRSKTISRIVAGSVWDLALSPRRDAVMYTKRGETRQQYVWLTPLDVTTGLASGSERRVSSHTADVPSISPDGKWAAFARDDSTGVGQSVVVVPIAGGDERVVAGALPSSIANIRWTPDGQTLYVGVNPPVPFTCAESCLSIPGGNPQVPGTIRRVAVGGGSADVVATTGNPSPGLSPDGTTLVFGDTKSARQFVIADANGHTINTFTLPPTQTQQGWVGNATLLTLTSGTVRRLRTVPITAGTSRVLFESEGAASASAAALSADAKTVSLLRTLDGRCELRSIDIDGTLRRAITLPDRGCGDGLTWTANQRTLLYTQYFPPDRRPVITAVNIATGQTQQLRDSRPAAMNWVVDGNDLVVSEVSTATGSQRRLSFSQIDFAGTARMLRELPYDEPPESFAAPIDRSTAIVMSADSHDFRLIRLDGGTDRRVALSTHSGYVLPRPSISADKEWVAFRVNPSGNNATRMNLVELIRLNETERRIIELPFFAQGQNSLVILPGAQDLIAVERPSPGVDPSVYLVNVATRSARKLFTYIPQGRLPEFVASSDGHTVLALTSEAQTPSVGAMNLSGSK